MNSANLQNDERQESAASFEKVAKDLRNVVVPVPNFPVAGVIFQDIQPLFLNPHLFRHVIDCLCLKFQETKCTCIMAAEARGWLFAAPMGYKLGAKVIMARKAGKLPQACVSVKYKLEYGETELAAEKNTLGDSDVVFVVDDILATGGTACAMVKLVGMFNGSRVGCVAFPFQLSQFRGVETLQMQAPGVDIFSICDLS